MPSRIGLMLDMTARNAGTRHLLRGITWSSIRLHAAPANQLLSEHEYREAEGTARMRSVAKMGAEAVRDALCRPINLADAIG